MTQYLDLLRDLELLLSRNQLHEAEIVLARTPDREAALVQLQEKGWLTSYQIAHLDTARVQELCIGPYVIVSKLGEGGMGVVYKAIQRALGRVVALKVLKSEQLNNPLAIRRFQREAKVTAHLNHPNIVCAYDLGKMEKGFYLVTEFIDGNNLAKLVETKGPLQVPMACEYIRQTAIGMHYAHQRGMIHRDIKPQNLMLTSDKTTIKILDLGLARLSGKASAAFDGTTPITDSGAFIGSVDFMSPEQAIHPRQADARADLYSMGCTFYYLLAGRVPFPCETVWEKISLHRDAAPETVESIRSEVPRPVAEIVNRLMAKDPNDRFQSCRELITEIDQVLGRKSGIQRISREWQQAPPNSKSFAESTDFKVSDSLDGEDHSANGLSQSPPTQVNDAVAVDARFPTVPGFAGGTKVTVKPAMSSARARKLRPKSRHLALVLGLAAIVLGCLNLVRSHETNSTQNPPSNPNDGSRAASSEFTNPSGPQAEDYRLELDGKTGYILVPAWRYDGSYPLTVEFWATPQEAGHDQVVFGDIETTGMCFQINSHDPKNPHWEFSIHDGQEPSTIISTVPVQWNQPAHIAASVGNGKAWLFVDGQQQGKLERESFYFQSSMPFAIGARLRRKATGSNDSTRDHFRGIIGEFRISKSVFYGNEFKPEDRLDTGFETILLYHLDEGKGEVAADASGNKRHGSIRGGATWHEKPK